MCLRRTWLQSLRSGEGLYGLSLLSSLARSHAVGDVSMDCGRRKARGVKSQQKEEEMRYAEVTEWESGLMEEYSPLIIKNKSASRTAEGLLHHCEQKSFLYLAAPSPTSNGCQMTYMTCKRTRTIAWLLALPTSRIAMVVQSRPALIDLASEETVLGKQHGPSLYYALVRRIRPPGVCMAIPYLDRQATRQGEAVEVE